MEEKREIDKYKLVTDKIKFMHNKNNQIKFFRNIEKSIKLAKAKEK